MINVDQLLYKIDFKLNKLSSNEHQQIALEDKILALNEAQIKLFKQKLDSNNVLQGGFDSFKKRYDDLQKFVETYEDHPVSLTLVDKTLNMWEADLLSLKPSYMFYVDAYLLADKGRCKDRRININGKIAKHADTTILLSDTNYRPSFEYQETFIQISSNGLWVFTDGTFTPKVLYISYLRYPKFIDKAGYEKLDGTQSVDQNCELKNYLEDELVDLAVQLLAMYTENPAAIQSAELRIKNNE